MTSNNDNLFESKQLGSIRPSVTSPVSIYTPDAGVKAELEYLWVSNLDSVSHGYVLFFDSDGIVTTLNEVLGGDPALGASLGVTIPLFNLPVTEQGNFAVQTTSADNINFILFGRERR